MFDNFPDINLDPTVQPKKDRLLKLALVPLALIVLVLSFLWIRDLDVFPAAVKVSNDMGGSLVCYQRYRTNGHDYVQDVGRVAPGATANIHAGSSCAVFDGSGRYVSCLIVPKGDVKTLAASTADRSVSTETCVYPR